MFIIHILKAKYLHNLPIRFDDGFFLMKLPVNHTVCACNLYKMIFYNVYQKNKERYKKNLFPHESHLFNENAT